MPGTPITPENFSLIVREISGTDISLHTDTRFVMTVGFTPQLRGLPANLCTKRITEIGKALRDQYDAPATPIPPQLVVLVKQLEARNPTYH
jgi:hypothetical protein